MILGGGPAGLATALRIVKGGGSAAVVERGCYNGICIGEHLPPAGLALLRSAGFSPPGDDAHLRCAGVNAWWGGRDMAPMLPKLFFLHFEGTSFVAENDDGTLAAFLIGFLSQTDDEEAYTKRSSFASR